MSRALFTALKFGFTAATLSASAALAQEAAAPPPPPTVTVAKPVVRDVVDSDEFIGRFEAVDQVAVRSRIDGYLDTVHFTDGALVKKGDPLFTIDQRPYVTALAQAKSSLEVAKTTLTYAEAQYKRTESLTGSGTLSVSTLDDQRRAFLAGQASVAGARGSGRRCSTQSYIYPDHCPAGWPHRSPADFSGQSGQCQRHDPDHHRLA